MPHITIPVPPLLPQPTPLPRHRIQNQIKQIWRWELCCRGYTHRDVKCANHGNKMIFSITYVVLVWQRNANPVNVRCLCVSNGCQLEEEDWRHFTALQLLSIIGIWSHTGIPCIETCLCLQNCSTSGNACTHILQSPMYVAEPEPGNYRTPSPVTTRRWPSDFYPQNRKKCHHNMAGDGGKLQMCHLRTGVGVACKSHMCHHSTGEVLREWLLTSHVYWDLSLPIYLQMCKAWHDTPPPCPSTAVSKHQPPVKRHFFRTSKWVQS
jgi:hypothetical protein